MNIRSMAKRTYRVAVCGLVLLALASQDKVTRAADNVGIQVPAGFEVSLYADDDLAHDIYSMTIDSLGRVVVSGEGYVRILIDKNGDGRADSFKQFVDGPKSGAQGMAFHGRDLLCTGDEGLIRYRDSNGDDRADGPPDVFLKIKTGSEHHAHSIQRGPDGWWYLIAGNYADVTSKYVTLPTSPIQSPNGGTVMRFIPNLTGGEIVADGYRNAYDFAFHPLGDLFVFDSDGERDVSLPWYRPTRVFQALPGSNAGWVSRSWKRPDDYADMPPVVADFGRGSPTGVVCYRHNQFPQKFHGALFVLDWTFGRVMALPLKQSGSVWSSKPLTFMSGIGQFGFAPTDAEIGPDGSLYVCVGGRGTRGSVYRVRYVGDNQTNTGSKQNSDSELDACLTAPQPLSSWSRTTWLRQAKQIGMLPLVKAARDKERPSAQRVRAIEILTELHKGIDTITLLNLTTAESADVRARAVWSAGRSGLIAGNSALLQPFLYDKDPLVVRCALETLIGDRQPKSMLPLYPAIVQNLRAKDRFVRQSAMQVVSQLSDESAATLEQLAAADSVRAALSFHLGRTLRATEFDAKALKAALEILKDDTPAGTALDAARLVQLALGDVGPFDKRPPAFDSYASSIALGSYRKETEAAAARLSAVYPTGDRRVDLELSRALAMLAPDDTKLLDRVLAQISDDTDPIDDIHHLIVAARILSKRTPAQREAIAAALVKLDGKVTARKLKLDSNWDTRVGEMYAALTKLDTELPGAIVKRPEFGRPGQVVFFSELSEEHRSDVIAAFVKHIQTDDDYPWSNEVVLLLSTSDQPEHRQLIRDQFESFGVRGAVLMVLAKEPEEQDRELFVEGLSSSQLNVLISCVTALSKLPASQEPIEQLALLRTLRRLGPNPGEYKLREQVVGLLQRNMKQDFGFVNDLAGYKPQPKVVRKWTEYLSNRYPKVSHRELGGGTADLSQLRSMLADVDWSKGDAARGRKLFEKRSCVQCHGGRSALGPDLAGVARRFSRDDLFVAIAIPNRDVSPRYQTTLVETTAGKVYTGLIIYESVEGLLLRNANNQTFRIEAEEIESRQTRPTSLMPNGLLKGLKPEELADLYQYINGL